MDADLFLSVLSLGELRKGCEALRPRDAGRATTLEAWLADIDTAFGPRGLGIDGRVAEVWGRMSAMRPGPVIDALLAATAVVHDLTLVTRNTSDVEGLGVKLLNPFIR